MAVVLFLSVMLIRSFLAGVTGAEPLSAQSVARFWGAPGNTKAMLATPQDRAAGCRSVASFLRSVGGQCPHILNRFCCVNFQRVHHSGIIGDATVI